MSQIQRITNFISKYPNKKFFILNISSGVLVKRIVQGGKTKFKVAEDKNIIPKDHLDIFNLCKKHYSTLLNSEFETGNELFFLFVSPYHAHIIKNYKEDLLLISKNKAIIPDSSYFDQFGLKSAEFSQNLTDLDDDTNYLAFVVDGINVIDSQIFYCDNYSEYLGALKEATFGNFLNILRTEEIPNETSFVSYLAKNGIPLLVQNKYLEFWKDYEDFHSIIDEILFQLRKKEIDVDEVIETSISNPEKALVKYLKYNIPLAQEFLEEIEGW